LCRHTSDKRFRVPIALALGKISSSWSQGSFDDLCYGFIQTQHEYDSLLPFNCYILINSIDNFVNYPSNDILFNALDRLIIAAGQHEWSIVCPFLFDQITNLLRKGGGAFSMGYTPPPRFCSFNYFFIGTEVRI